MGRSTARVIMTVAGIVILAGFFMPWFDFQKLDDASGFTILRKGDLTTLWLAILLAVPAFGLLLSAAGLSGVKYGRYMALLVGALIIGYGAYRFFQLFFSVTGPGIWFVVAGGLIALIVGLMPALPEAPSSPSASLPKPKSRPVSKSQPAHEVTVQLDADADRLTPPLDS
jgi:hypothetical protein